jgi:capsid protein
LIKAYSQKDYVKIEALNKATFTGVAVPSIDPLKEVNAVRKAMGDETTPLMSGEKGAEIISQEDYTELQEKVTEERKIAVKPKDNGSENNQ